MTTGRNYDEVLLFIDSLQLTAKHKVSTPVNWRQGEDVIIAGSVSDDQAREIFGEWKAPRPYIRIVPQPRSSPGTARPRQLQLPGRVVRHLPRESPASRALRGRRLRTPASRPLLTMLSPAVATA